MIVYLFWIPTGLYVTGWLLAFVRYWNGHEEPSVAGGWVLAGGWAFHTVYLVLQFSTGGISLGILLGFAAWVALILFFLMFRGEKATIFGFVLPPFAVAVLLAGAFISKDGLLSPENFPATPWLTQSILVTHIITMLGGQMLFALGCLLSIAYLYQEHRLKAKNIGFAESGLPSLGNLDQLNHRAISLGFFFLSIGILLGVITGGLANLPVRLLTLRLILPVVTWLVYAVFLLEHSFQGRRGRFLAIWSIAGFVIVSTSFLLEMVELANRG